MPSCVRNLLFTTSTMRRNEMFGTLEEKLGVRVAFGGERGGGSGSNGLNENSHLGRVGAAIGSVVGGTIGSRVGPTGGRVGAAAGGLGGYYAGAYGGSVATGMGESVGRGGFRGDLSGLR